jgi:hypothetical protein
VGDFLLPNLRYLWISQNPKRFNSEGLKPKNNCISWKNQASKAWNRANSAAKGDSG